MPPGLRLEDYEYPPDRQDLIKLQRMRELQLAVGEHIKEFAEPFINGQLNGTGVKVSRRQLPVFNDLVEQTASILNVSRPQVFIKHDPFLNAFTFGTGHQNIIVVTNSLFEQMNEDQMAFILGHEMGHIKSQHVLYNGMYQYLQSRRNRFSESLAAAILDWQRKSEVTADRAGLIACQDIDQACLALLALAAGSVTLASQLNRDEYMESQLLSLDFNPVGQQAEMASNHHFIPVRMRQLLDYFHSPHYSRLWGNNEALPDNDGVNDLDIELK